MLCIYKDMCICKMTIQSSPSHRHRNTNSTLSSLALHSTLPHVLGIHQPLKRCGTAEQESKQDFLIHPLTFAI